MEISRLLRLTALVGSVFFAVVFRACGQSAAGSRWDWTGCNPRDLCECKLHGQVGDVKGTDIASECQDNGYAIPKVNEMGRLYGAVSDNKHRFQCDSLKLNAFCFSQNGCLTETNQASCNAMKGKSCDVDCNSSLGKQVPFAVLLPILLAALHL